MDFEQIIRQTATGPARRMAVAAAADAYVLRAAYQAHLRRIATPILCGDAEAVKQAALEAGVDISGFALHPAATEKEAAATAVRLVKSGEADMLMKGMLQTATLLRAVLDKEHGLRGEGILSHVSILHSPLLARRFLLTDAAMVPYPDLPAKADLLRNAVYAAHRLGIRTPRVAVLAAVEVVNPAMQATVDAAALTQMNRRGQITGCVVDGPLAMDLALSEEAAAHKGVTSEVAGKADILLLHSIEAANSVLKTFTMAGACLFGGVIVGATAPIVLTSRSDSEQSKLYAIACAAAIAEVTGGAGA